jgi:uncharacterized MAPEG superfamily protein
MNFRCIKVSMLISENVTQLLKEITLFTHFRIVYVVFYFEDVRTISPDVFYLQLIIYCLIKKIVSGSGYQIF